MQVWQRWGIDMKTNIKAKTLQRIDTEHGHVVHVAGMWDVYRNRSGDKLVWSTTSLRGALRNAGGEVVRDRSKKQRRSIATALSETRLTLSALTVGASVAHEVLV